MAPPNVDLSALAQKALRKSQESVRAQQAFFTENSERLGACSVAMAAAFDGGGRLFAFGNGGSACDAQHLAVELMHPIVEKRPGLPALCLTQDSALLSAIGNDEDFSLAFARQLQLLAHKGDVALGISTSGKSRNVLRGLAAAREKGALTVGLTGRDGGRMAEVCDHAFRVESFSIHRIQEVHTAFIHVLWDLIHVVRGEEDVL